MSKFSFVFLVLGFCIFFTVFFFCATGEINRRDQQILQLREKIEILASRECQECSRRARWEAEQRAMLSNEPM
jgi:hypothetical protein